jgi:alcohol oxidase
MWTTSRSTSAFDLDAFFSPLERPTNPFSENRATGVIYALNPLLHPDAPRDTRTVRGTKLVIVSAGAFGSPGILERSGIGAKDVLEGVGVKQHVDLPGVGESYQGFSMQRSFLTFSPLTFVCACGADHSVLFIKYFAADEAQSLDAIFRGEEGAVDGMSVLLSSFSLRGVLARALRLTTVLQLQPPNLGCLGKRS